MSLVSGLLGATSKTLIGQVQCDAVVTEVHILEADMTEHAVESGSFVADHYRKRPNALQIEGIISRTPILTGFPGLTAIGSVQAIASGQDPIKNAWEYWEYAMDFAQPLIVATARKPYINMMILSLQETRSNVDQLRFSMTLKKKKTAYTTTVEALAGVAAEAASETAQEIITEGQQASEEAQGASILASLIGL